MRDFETERFVEEIDDLKKQFLNLAEKCRIYEAALSAPDKWAVPGIEEGEGRYAYIPIFMDNFADILVELDRALADDPDFRHSNSRYRPFSVIEIGCGIGRNLNILKHQELLPVAKAVGFDVVPEYVEVARVLYGFGDEVFVGDCMEQDYAGFDVMFFYRPFSDDDMETAFEKHLLSSAKTGSVIVGVSSVWLEHSRETMPLGESNQIYKKL